MGLGPCWEKAGVRRATGSRTWRGAEHRDRRGARASGLRAGVVGSWVQLRRRESRLLGRQHPNPQDKPDPCGLDGRGAVGGRQVLRASSQMLFL